MKSPLVSIIIPCYKQAEWLGEALDSVYAQTYTCWECIIINDGSPDNTEEVANLYCNKDARFKYVLKDNGGHSSARNMGIRHSIGKYILPLDGDDRISNTYVEKAVWVLEKSPEIKMVTAKAEYFGNKSGECIFPEYDFKTLLMYNCFHITTFFRREDFDKTSGFDETMLGFEDWNLWIGILKHGGEVYTIPDVCFFYRMKDVSTFQDLRRDQPRLFADLLRLYNNQIESYEKYFSSPITLIQENEKLNRIVTAYQQSRTYKWGMKLRQFRKLLKSGA